MRLRRPYSRDFAILVWTCRQNKPNGLSPFAYRDHFSTSLQLVQIIRPLLHHFLALRQMGRTVVCAPVWIAHGSACVVARRTTSSGSQREHLSVLCGGSGRRLIL